MKSDQKRNCARQSRRQWLAAAGLLSAAVLVTQPDAVQAQSVPAGATNDSSSQGLETVVVTARLRSESLQEVPVAVDAFSAKTLQDALAGGATVAIGHIHQTGNSADQRILVRGQDAIGVSNFPQHLNHANALRFVQTLNDSMGERQ